ncbi:MAG TPA: S8 family serine peptidase [Bacteroidales bacterium]|nr:S8 family serine peptidase [Bacteroidales bacterium]
MKSGFGLLMAFLLLPLLAGATDDVLRFRLYLTDKPDLTMSPMPYRLSPAALERRSKQGIALDSTDLPIFPGYLSALREKGFLIVSQSRWMNTVVVSMADSSGLNLIKTLPFVRSAKLVWMNPAIRKASAKRKLASRNKYVTDSISYYGKAETQVEMLGLDALHAAGFKGNNITIAIIDAGFLGADTISLFKNIKLKTTRDFIYPATTVYNSHFHGTAVLSLMASQQPYSIVGTAPDATYCLLRSEDNNSEFPIEEDYWAAAAEFADSIGADIINSSLGYNEFDFAPLSYTQSQLDGKTAFITKAATLAASKGMLVVSSAGNDGSKPWRKISFPSDAPEVLAVGAVQNDLSRAAFSSMGPTADGRIKPDIMALGVNNTIINGSGVLTYGSGTSYSAPLIAGMAACLWNAFPMLKSSDLRTKIIESGDRYLSPDTLYGAGVPNAQKLWLTVRNLIDQNIGERFYCYPSPASDKLFLVSFLQTQEVVKIIIYNTFGKKVLEKNMTSSSYCVDVSNLPNSIYLVEFIVAGVRQVTQKILVQR